MHQQAETLQGFAGAGAFGEGFEDAAGNLVRQYDPQDHHNSQGAAFPAPSQHEIQPQNSPGNIPVVFIGNPDHQGVKKRIGDGNVEEKKQRVVEILKELK